MTGTTSAASPASSARAPSPSGRAIGSTVRALLRVLVAAGLTAYILWKSHPRAVLDAAAGADWRPILAAVLLVVLDRTLMAYRWVLLLCTVDRAVRPPLSAVMRIFFVSTFVGTFLPASVGGDAVRAYSLAKLDVGGGDAVASVLMDRMLGVASILLMALAGLILARDLAGNTAIVLSLSVAAVACGLTLLLIFDNRTDALARAVIGRVPAARLREAGSEVLLAIRRYAVFRGALVNVLVCSVLVQVLRIVQAYYLGRSLDVSAPLVTYFAFIPLILLVMLLPVTVNGIGTSQLAFVWFFARVGVPAPNAFTLSVLFVALGIVGNLPGGLLYAFGGANRATDEGRPASGR
jgi:glycosyltransferase 2 family protein